jgi:hypothetical protein
MPYDQYGFNGKRRSDIGRTRALQAAGWLVIFASADDIARPHSVTASIRAGLTDRGWRPDDC